MKQPDASNGIEMTASTSPNDFKYEGGGDCCECALPKCVSV